MRTNKTKPKKKKKKRWVLFQMEIENISNQCWSDILLDDGLSNSNPKNQFQGTAGLGETWLPLLRLLVILGLWDTLICLLRSQLHILFSWLLQLSLDMNKSPGIWWVTLVTIQIRIVVLCFMITWGYRQQDSTSSEMEACQQKQIKLLY